MISTRQPLLEIAQPDLYLRNAFRTTGVATDAPARDIRQRRRQLTAAMDIGAPVHGAEPLAGPVTGVQVREAFDLLTDPSRRLIQETFWFWGQNSETNTCECAKGAHGRHDSAVQAHASALRAELQLSSKECGQYWTKALDNWRLVLESDDLGTHLRHRAAVLDDPRLGPSAVDAIVTSIPIALVTLNANLAVRAESNADIDRHVSYVKRWAVVSPEDLADIVDGVLAPLLDQVLDVQQKARLLRNAGESLEAADLVVEKAKPLVMRARRIAAYDQHRRTDIVANDTAILLNNAWLDVSSEVRRKGSLGLSLGRRGREYLDSALEMVVEEDDRKIMRANQGTLPHKARPTVTKPRVARPKSAVRRWIDGVIVSGDEEYLYDLLVLWHTITNDPGLSRQLQAEMVKVWPEEEKRRRLRRGRRLWAGAIVLAVVVLAAVIVNGVAAVAVTIVSIGIAGAVGLYGSTQRNERRLKYLDPHKLPGGTS